MKNIQMKIADIPDCIRHASLGSVMGKDVIHVKRDYPDESSLLCDISGSLYSRTIIGLDSPLMDDDMTYTICCRCLKLSKEKQT